MLTEFSGLMSHPLEFGHALEIVAKTIDAASQFHISLCTEKAAVNAKADIGLRFSPNFLCKDIERNARIDGEWGEAEFGRLLNESSVNPIRPGDFFIVYFLACEDKFHIAINGRPSCTFNYRLPLSSIRVLEIYDQIQTVKQVDHRTVFPSPWPPIHTADHFKDFSNDVPILFSPGHVIVITGRCFDYKNGQFIIKFLDSDKKREEFHFSVRFDDKVVVRNSMNKSYEFGMEERHGGFPFVLNQQFKLAIAFTAQEFLIAVDGYNFCTYAYRTANILENLVGFKLACRNGLRMHITAVDHIHMSDPSCTNFETYSTDDVNSA